MNTKGIAFLDDHFSNVGGNSDWCVNAWSLTTDGKGSRYGLLALDDERATDTCDLVYSDGDDWAKIASELSAKTVFSLDYLSMCSAGRMALDAKRKAEAMVKVLDHIRKAIDHLSALADIPSQLYTQGYPFKDGLEAVVADMFAWYDMLEDEA